MKFTNRSTAAALLACLPFVSLRVLAAPPLVTDDASTLAPGMCQLETEQRRYGNRQERDVVPACNFLFDAEFGIGAMRVSADGQPRRDSVIFQVKKVFTPADSPEWAFGAAAAIIRATGNQSGTRQQFVSALFTRSFAATAVHLNLGIVRNNETITGGSRHRISWAAAVEHEATPRWTIAGEVFGLQGLPSSVQAGLRWWAIPTHVQLTSSLGAVHGGGRDGRWVSIGIRFESGNLFSR